MISSLIHNSKQFLFPDMVRCLESENEEVCSSLDGRVTGGSSFLSDNTKMMAALLISAMIGGLVMPMLSLLFRKTQFLLVKRIVLSCKDFTVCIIDKNGNVSAASNIFKRLYPDCKSREDCLKETSVSCIDQELDMNKLAKGVSRFFVQLEVLKEFSVCHLTPIPKGIITLAQQAKAMEVHQEMFEKLPFPVVLMGKDFSLIKSNSQAQSIGFKCPGTLSEALVSGIPGNDFFMEHLSKPFTQIEGEKFHLILRKNGVLKEFTCDLSKVSETEAFCLVLNNDYSNEASDLATALSNLQGRLIKANKQFYAFFDIEDTGKELNLKEILEGSSLNFEDLVQQTTSLTLEGTNQFSSSLTFYGQSTKEANLDVNIDKAGRVRFQLRDVSSQQAVQKHLEEVTALEKQGTLALSRLQHSMRNNLTILSGMLRNTSSMLERAIELDSDTPGLGSLLHQIKLDVSKTQSAATSIGLELKCSLEEKSPKKGNQEVLNVLKELKDLIFEHEHCFNQANKTLNVCLDENFNDISIDLDYVLIKDILSNLISNGQKAISSGGTVSITLSVLTETDLEVKVRDNGVGIPKEERESIFLHKVQGVEASEGAGIGLAHCVENIERLGGSITLDSMHKDEGPGSYAEFTLILPCVQPYKSLTKEGTHLIQSGSLSQEKMLISDTPIKTILIVDDIPEVRQVIREYLSDLFETIEILEAGCFEESVKKVRCKPADVVFMDSNLPYSSESSQGLHALLGLELTKELKANDRASYVIGLSGKEFTDQYIDSCFECGQDEVLSKPYDQQILYEVLVNIDKHLKSKKALKNILASSKDHSHNLESKPRELKKTALTRNREQLEIKMQDYTPTKIPEQLSSILVVDDTTIGHPALESMLKELGFQPIFVVNKEDAINLLEQKDFKTIIIDTQFPDSPQSRINEKAGHQLLDHITKKHASEGKERPLCIAFTGNEPNDENLTKYLDQEGYDEFLTKDNWMNLHKFTYFIVKHHLLHSVRAPVDPNNIARNVKQKFKESREIELILEPKSSWSIELPDEAINEFLERLIQATDDSSKLVLSVKYSQGGVIFEIYCNPLAIDSEKNDWFSLQAERLGGNFSQNKNSLTLSFR